MEPNPADSPRVLHLEIEHNGTTQKLQFQESLLPIGRAASNRPSPKIAVNDLTVSRSQAEIRWLGRNYWIADRGSLTGTYVNGERLAPGDRVPLTTGTRLTFGNTTAIVRIERRADDVPWDVFLCHSNQDKPQVRCLANGLRNAGLNPWLDEQQLDPAVSFITEMSKAIQTIGIAVVAWGPNSPGRWQLKEIEFLQKAAVEEGVRLIPVVLEGVERDPEWPVFMDLLQRIDFRKSGSDAMRQLIEILIRMAT